MLRALLLALHCIARLENKVLWQHGKEDEGQAVLCSLYSPLPLQRTMLGVQVLPCTHHWELRSAGMGTCMQPGVGCSPFCWPRPAAVAWAANAWSWSWLGHSQKQGCLWAHQHLKLHL